uniref:Transposase IS116/IS110/IS902 family protein n=1 Tax=Candidatus Kentrum sp. LFY TaxID=2126342 RepID=A0A450UQR6_9GAMM|nr:MAG: hypothetical protein BECKLFY1418B_GA0070995_10638 [Candidatus Kentron sp. LFY]
MALRGWSPCGYVVHGKSAREMIEELSRRETPEQVLQYASSRLEATIDVLLDALAGESTADHTFVLSETLDHIEDLERRIAIFARQLLSRLDPYKSILQALQTIPGIDKIGTGMLLVEIGDDMTEGSPASLSEMAALPV